MYEEINTVNSNFFWKINFDNNDDHSPIQSLAWDMICRSKCERGLCLGKTENVNAIFFFFSF